MASLSKTRRTPPEHRADLSDLPGAVQIGFCKVCGRPLFTIPGLSGGVPDYCRPIWRKTRKLGRTLYVRDSRSTCATIAKRTEELRRLAVALTYELSSDSRASSEEVRQFAQAVKAYVWAEMNAATNSFGRLVKKARQGE